MTTGITEAQKNKFLPNVITRDELPEWFIVMADSRSRGSMEYIVSDSRKKNILYVDYFIEGNFLETRIFEMQPKQNLQQKNK